MASPSSVLTLGLGSWGSTSLVITSGFGVGEAATVVVDVFIPMMGTPNLFPSAKGTSGYFATMQSSQNIYPAMKGEQ